MTAPENPAAAAQRSPIPLPLAGMRVIELSSFVASPLGGMTLARLGADVIRVEPLTGGPDRRRRPLAPSGASLYWAGLNQGKRSLAVDLRSPQGRELIGDLVAAGGDGGGIVLTNSRPAPGLSPDELRARRPDLIHVALNGRRDGGTAVDYTVNAECGFPYLTGPPELATPVNNVLPAWDIATGLYLAVGLLAAERHRARTGAGQTIEVALYDVALATAGQLGYFGEVQLCAQQRRRMGNDLYGDFGRDFATADGARFMLVVLTPRHWSDLVAATGLASAITGIEKTFGADFDTAEDRFHYRETLSGLIATWFRSRGADEAEEVLATTSVLWSRYRSFSDVVADGTLAGHPMFGELDQPGIGSYLAPGSPLVIDHQQLPPTPAPLLGQHSDEVLTELLALEPARIADLRARRIVAG